MNPRFKIYLDAGGDKDNNWRFMQFISTGWLMYGKEIGAARSIDGAYRFTDEQRETFTSWLENEVKNGLTEQFTCNLGLQTEGR